MNTGINEVAANNNITHCNSTISRTSSLSGLSGHITSTTSSSSGHSTSTSTTSAPSQTTTAAASGSAPSSKVPIIVGAAVGGVFVLVAAAVARFCWRKRQRRRLTHVSLDADSVHAPEMSIISPYTVSGESLVILSVNVRTSMLNQTRLDVREPESARVRACTQTGSSTSAKQLFLLLITFHFCTTSCNH